MKTRERIEHAAAVVDGGSANYLPTPTKIMLQAAAREALLIAKERLIVSTINADREIDHLLAELQDGPYDTHS